MKRKVIKQGPSTLMISLPLSWVKKFNILRGDIVDVEERESLLEISTGKEIDLPAIEIDTTGLDLKHTKRYLEEAYKSGYSELKITFDKLNQSELQDFISRIMIGYEIMDQHEHFFIVKSISTNIYEEFEPILRRAFLVAKQFSENVHEAIKKGEFSKLKDILILEETIDKLTNFCERVIVKKGYKQKSKDEFMYCLVWQLEKIGDDYKYICYYLKDLKEIKLNEEVISLMEKVNKLFDEFYTLFYSYSKKNVMHFSSESEKLIKEARDLQIKSKTSHDIIITSILSVLVSKIYNLLGPFIGTVV